MDMSTKKRLNYGARQLAPLIIVLGLILGCAMEKEITPKAKDPFFEKWREKAKDSRGHSPTAKKYSADLPAEKDTGAPSRPTISPPKEKPLPVDEVTLKMHDVDVATLLRALARSADQNIVISEKVTGKTNIFQYALFYTYPETTPDWHVDMSTQFVEELQAAGYNSAGKSRGWG